MKTGAVKFENTMANSFSYRAISSVPAFYDISGLLVKPMPNFSSLFPDEFFYNNMILLDTVTFSSKEKASIGG
ncbi:MAG: hypothetical protein HY513_00605 [Candidatus Aenigmarchaeota archaeon]|nr:hypothetical protein [Candidatus Aenigmarchaeota archaeon]